jgi:hypothetical protein
MTTSQRCFSRKLMSKFNEKDNKMRYDNGRLLPCHFPRQTGP